MTESNLKEWIILIGYAVIIILFGLPLFLYYDVFRKGFKDIVIRLPRG